MIRPYLIRDSYHAQIEGGNSFFHLRMGYTCLGIACWPMRGTKSTDRWFHRFLPLASLTLWSHTGQRDIRIIVKARCFGFGVADWKTRGERIIA
jgi:hypothetical protein